MCRTQPCFVFAGEQFENDGSFKLAKGMILDMFRGRLIESINLKVCTVIGFLQSSDVQNGLLAHACVIILQGLDHVIFVAAVDGRLLFRTYAIRLKKSGTQV